MSEFLIKKRWIRLLRRLIFLLVMSYKTIFCRKEIFMKTLKKIIALVVCLCCITTVGIVASAGEYAHMGRKASTLGHNFSQKWKDYRTYTIEGISYDFTYGFDTFIINEDYIENVKAQAEGSQYYGKVKNSNGATQVTNKVTGTDTTDTASVKHTGNTVVYYVFARKL